MNESETVEKLKNCSKINSISRKNCIGQSFIGRLMTVTDGDTLVVSRYRDGYFETESIRVARIDTAEVSHTESDYKPDATEELFGNKAKLTVLNWFLPEVFSVTPTQKHDWRFQKPIFDKHCVLIRVECSATCIENGKCIPLKQDPYGRIVAEVKKYRIKEENTQIDESLSDMLLRLKLALPYTGGKKTKVEE